MRGTVIDHTWKRHVKELRDSYLCPPVMDAINDCAFPEEREHCMPAVMETGWNEGLLNHVTSEG